MEAARRISYVISEGMMVTFDGLVALGFLHDQLHICKMTEPLITNITWEMLMSSLIFMTQDNQF